MRVFRIAIGYLAAAYCAGLIFWSLILQSHSQVPDRAMRIWAATVFRPFGTLFCDPCNDFAIGTPGDPAPNACASGGSPFTLSQGFITGATVSSAYCRPTGKWTSARQSAQHWRFLDLLPCFWGCTMTPMRVIVIHARGGRGCRRRCLPFPRKLADKPRSVNFMVLPLPFAGLVLSARAAGRSTRSSALGTFRRLYAESAFSCGLMPCRPWRPILGPAPF